MACCPKAASNALVCEACGGPTHSKPPAQLPALRRLSLSVGMPPWMVREKGSRRTAPLEKCPVGEFSKNLELMSYPLSLGDRDTYRWNCAPARWSHAVVPTPYTTKWFLIWREVRSARWALTSVLIRREDGDTRQTSQEKTRSGCGQRSVKLKVSSTPQSEGRSRDGLRSSGLRRHHLLPPGPQELSHQTSVL